MRKHKVGTDGALPTAFWTALFAFSGIAPMTLPGTTLTVEVVAALLCRADQERLRGGLRNLALLKLLEGRWVRVCQQ